jgi:hypothetical protein
LNLREGEREGEEGVTDVEDVVDVSLPKKMMAMNWSKSYWCLNPHQEGRRTSRRHGSRSAHGVDPPDP